MEKIRGQHAFGISAEGSPFDDPEGGMDKELESASSGLPDDDIPHNNDHPDKKTHNDHNWGGEKIPVNPADYSNFNE
jgi:hypothetical protein